MRTYALDSRVEEWRNRVYSKETILGFVRIVLNRARNVEIVKSDLVWK